MKLIRSLTAVFIILITSSVFTYLGAQELYWEDEEVLVKSGADFSSTASGGDLIASIWQEGVRTGDEGGEFYLSGIFLRDGEEWTTNKRFAGPYTYTGNQNYFFSFVVDDSGVITLAVSENDNSVGVYRSSDGGMDFELIYSSEAFPVRVAPRLSRRSDGGLILFVTQESFQDNFSSLGIYYSVSDNGKRWTRYRQLAPEPELKGNFLPSHTSWRGREFVVFQAFKIGSTSTFQLYLKYSDDGGRRWSDSIFLTGFEDESEFYEGDPFVFDNQRPFILGTPSGISFVWERSFLGGNPQIYYGRIDFDGNLSQLPEQVSKGLSECRSPRLSHYRGNDQIIWFDNRSGDYHNILASKDGVFWNEDDLNYLTAGSSVFGNILISSGEMFIIWENDYQRKKRLMMLAPDKSIIKPVMRAANFTSGKPSRQNKYVIRWNSPEDSSGISGYSYSWGPDKSIVPEKKLKMLDKNRKMTVEFDQDGKYYFQVIAQDYAGNWSEPSIIEIIRDTTPPGRVTFIEPEVDENGALLSNTSSISWLPPEEEVSGYSYNLQFLRRWNWSGDEASLSFRTPAARVMTKKTDYPFRNIDNGLWALNVRAIDVAGNIGETETMLFRLNKYIPVTYITKIESERNDLGVVKLKIIGRGFSVGGKVSQVILDRDGIEPYDYIYLRDDDLFTVESDRYISGPALEDIEAGKYRIGLIHPKRGLYFTKNGISIESSGTVKLGDFSVVPERQLTGVSDKKFTIPFKYILFGLIMLLLLILFIFTLSRTIKVVSEAKILRREALALIEGDSFAIKEQKERISQMAKIRMGLRFKFSLLMTVLVLLIVSMISIPIAFITSENQKDILASGLEDRVEVLIESITSGARTFLPSGNIIELSTLPSQMSALGEDALFVTITGHGNTSSENYDPDKYDYVWATNDSSLTDKAGTAGDYLMTDTISEFSDDLALFVNDQASSKVGLIVDDIERLNKQVEPLVARFIRTGNREDEKAIDSIQDELRELDKELNARLYEVGNTVSSFPEYNSEDLSFEFSDYVFYKPIVYKAQGDNSYFRGIVRLVSALILSSIIIRPIKALVRGVELIRDTEDKEQLENHQIMINTHDEISLLADTVNQMTSGLVKAAVASKDLTVGKEVQKMFIPLEKNEAGLKTSIGRENTDNIDFFGYYEGAKGVSGDYFDFRKIDQVHYAAIKCDVAGKGVPASLIMVEVATIFLSFFRNRKTQKDQYGKPVVPNIVDLTYSINDMLEERGFQGRFAAFTIIIINSETGELNICNAGDKLLHIYDHKQRKMVIKELPESPAAGVFDSDVVRMGTGFVQVNDRMNPGDSLLMFTDGLEEAQRKFRDEKFSIIECNWKGLERGTEHDTHPVGNDNEEFGIPRIHAIINAINNREKYSLYKYHNPFGDEELIFDFTKLNGSIEDIVMAAVSVERVFRLYPDPSAGQEDRVNVDKAIVKFLKATFEGYDRYFANEIPGKESDLFISFSHIKEDEQYDDLTILGINKK